ncbi:hypothetical protein [Nocardiopsis synnemataformans]|uniref:hypothetical protein n=1 Tax=Nocardiopsis synnemataformans TaxID=61305 RepID=UPI003EBB902B
MTRTWGTPPEPTAEDPPDQVAAQDARTGVRRCRTGCVAIKDARGVSSDVDSHSFICHGCGGAVCIGCRTTPVVSGMLFCTPCGNAQAAMSAQAFPDLVDDDYTEPSEEPMTAGQMRALLAGVGDDVPLRALYGPHLKNGMREWEIVAARHILQGKPPEGPRVCFALYLRGDGHTSR